MDQKKINALFKRLEVEDPNPTTELKYQTDFELLIAVVLSAQATDVSVNKATEHLFAIANTPEKILELTENGLKDYIKTIGLYNSKANNIIKLCDILVTQHNSQVPNTREALEALPGVGRKTANVVLNTAFGQPTIAVDTHIFRVANRTGLAKGSTPLAVEQVLTIVVPAKYQKNAHHWLILLGRYICQARKPKCHQCPIVNLCEYPNKNGKPTDV